MREIKFRAWDKLQKRILYREIFDMNWYGTERNDDKGCHTIRGTQQSDRNILELMQYTGLKDKNGKEIYEGDIVRDKYNHNGVVEYYLPFAGFIARHDRKDRVVHIQLDQQRNEFEVIGNIHENKELLQ